MTRSTFYECRYFLRPNRDQLQNILLQGLGFTFPKPEELIAYFTIIYTYTSGRNSRLVMRRKRKQVFVLLLVLLALSIFYTLNKHGHSMYQAIGNLGCDEVRGRKLLHDLCVFYEEERVAGNLCEDICRTGRLVIEQCLSHKNDNVIFSANWRGKTVILKAKKMSSYDSWEYSFPGNLSKNLTALRKMFLSSVHDHVMQKLINFENFTNRPLEKPSPQKLLALLYFNASIDSLRKTEMQSLWYLLQQDEYFVMKLLQDLRHIPHIYGTCGQFYALEKVKTLDDYIGVVLLSSLLTWRTCVKIALETMDLVRELSLNTGYGPWQHCDIQPSNFGLDSNGVIKAIDVDLMFTDEKMVDVLSQQAFNCTMDTDCEFFDCASQCNVRTKKCLAKRVTNNLQVVCRDLFLSKWVERGLLTRIPSRSKAKFAKILQECSVATNRPWTKRKYDRIFNTLHGYLREEQNNLNT